MRDDFAGYLADKLRGLLEEQNDRISRSIKVGDVVVAGTYQVFTPDTLGPEDIGNGNINITIVTDQCYMLVLDFLESGYRVLLLESGRPGSVTGPLRLVK